MSLFKRNDTHIGGSKLPTTEDQYKKVLGTTDKAKALEYHDKLKAQLWDQDRLGIKPRYSWKDAVVRYLAETTEKATQETDRSHLRWLDPYLSDRMLDEINRDLLEMIMAKRLAGKVANSTVNRTMETVRAILRKAAFDWEWTERVPKVRMLPEPKRRVRWITKGRIRAANRCITRSSGGDGEVLT